MHVLLGDHDDSYVLLSVLAMVGFASLSLVAVFELDVRTARSQGDVYKLQCTESESCDSTFMLHRLNRNAS
jgi:hypothetical protein